MVALGAAQVVAGAHQSNLLRDSADIQRRVAEMNAEFAEYDAARAELEGESTAAQYASTVARVVSGQQEAFISQNVDYSFGTAAEVVTETKVRGMLNQSEIRQQAAMKAMGYRLEALNIRMQGGMNESNTRRAADTAMIGGLTSGLSTGVSGYMRA